MTGSLIPFAVLGIVLVLAVLALAIWRWRIAMHEDETLHVAESEETGTIHRQQVIAQKLNVVDKWGKAMTVVTVVYLMVLAGAYAYQYWVTASMVR